MNAVLSFISANRERLGLEQLGVSLPLLSILLTPRFRASRHVVMLLLPEGSSDPALVAKMPRLRGDSEGVERERAVLTLAQDRGPDGMAGVPRVVAFEEVGERPLLLETALVGVPMTPEQVRRRPAESIGVVLAWLEQLPRSDATLDQQSYVRLLDQPLRRFRRVFTPDGAADLVDRTLELVEPLGAQPVPWVIEHGDLSHPNLLWLRDGTVGVVDWELGERHGLPGHDLFFFLNYVATALSRAGTSERQVRAFHEAVIDRRGWARESVTAYADRLQLDRALLPSLLVACWARATTRLLERLLGSDAESPPEGGDSGSASVPTLTPQLADWLRGDRHYALWRHAVEHARGAF